MSRTLLLAAVGSLFLAGAAQADTVAGTFTGTMTFGNDVSGVFGPSGADLTNDAVSGTFDYNTNLLSQSISGGVNTATGTGLGALTITLMIGTNSYVFTDQTSSTVTLDSGSVSSLNGITLTNANGGDTITLQVIDPGNPTLSSTDLTQSFSSTNPLIGTGNFTIDNGPNSAGGAFSITTLTGAQVPEPASFVLLAVGLLGIVVVKRKAAGAY